jgi:VWFA-related protein
VLIVVDEDSMQAGDGPLVKRETNRFLDKLDPSDYVGVAMIPTTKSVLSLTRDRARTRVELASASPHLELTRYLLHIGLTEALQASEDRNVRLREEIMWRECGDTLDPALKWSNLRDTRPGPIPNEGGKCRQYAMDQMAEMVREARARGQRFIDALVGVAGACSQVPGSKTMVLVSGGTPMTERYQASQVTRLNAVFAAGQITLYTIFLERSPYDASKTQTSPTELEDMRLEEAGLANATSTVGGTFMRAIGTVDQYFDRVVRELAGYYLLGVEVDAADHDGRSHQVAVKVDRRQVDVRARKEYVIPKPAPSSPR